MRESAPSRPPDAHCDRPNGTSYFSLGQRPRWLPAEQKMPALKGRPKAARGPKRRGPAPPTMRIPNTPAHRIARFRPPLQGWMVRWVPFNPGRCPGLTWCRPVGARWAVAIASPPWHHGTDSRARRCHSDRLREVGRHPDPSDHRLSGASLRPCPIPACTDRILSVAMLSIGEHPARGSRGLGWTARLPAGTDTSKGEATRHGHRPILPNVVWTALTLLLRCTGPIRCMA